MFLQNVSTFKRLSSG